MSKEEGSVIHMLSTLKLNSLQEGHVYNLLVMLYKIAGSNVPTVDPTAYLTPKHERHTIKVKSYTDFSTLNILDRHSCNYSCSFVLM
jgi:hypothetical protein